MSNWNSETAEWYAKEYGEYPTNKLAVEAISLSANSTIVDIGCGTGSALRYASKQVTNGVLVGIDPVPRMLEIAREQTANHPAVGQIVYYEGSAEKIPIDDGIADFVFAFDSFDHWQNKTKGFSEIRRILKINGRLIVVKDGGLPNGSEAQRAFVELLATPGFYVIEERAMDESGISFTLWICGCS